MAKDNKPTLKELLLYVVPRAASVWEELGIALNLDEDGTAVDSIAEKRAGDAKKCCTDVLKAWRQGRGEEPKTWAVLIHCLRDIGAEDVIESITENALGRERPGTARSTGDATGATPQREQSPKNNIEKDEANSVASRELNLEPVSTTSPSHSHAPTPPLVPESESTSISLPMNETEVSPTDAAAKTETVTVKSSSSCESSSDIQQPTSSANGTPKGASENSQSPGLKQKESSREPVETDQHVLGDSTQPESAEKTLATQPHPERIDTLQDQPDDEPELKPLHDVSSPAVAAKQHTLQDPERTEQSEDQVGKASTTPLSTASSREQDLEEPRREVDFSLRLKEGCEIRGYQRELAQPGLNGENYIICAPTGTGKTLVAGIIVADSLQKTRGHGKVVFVVNTKPLAQQQTKELGQMIPNARVACCTGDSEMTIKILLSDKEIVVCTAGKLKNELQNSMIRLKQIKLLIIDECHHTTGSTPQALMMQKYLKTKFRQRKYLPQVIGLTASPGAGDNPRLELSRTLDHLSSLCALMDATSGIKKTTDHIRELESHTKKPQLTTKIRKRREATEEFIVTITDEMERLEALVGLKCHFNKWTQEYQNSVGERKRHYEMSTDPSHRHIITVLEVLQYLTRALNIYMDLRYEDAMSIIDELRPPQGSKESELSAAIGQLKDKLSRLRRVPNPLLETLKSTLEPHFSLKPGSKGIVFVQTKKHAVSICEFIKGMYADKVAIHPGVITGHTHETGLAMTQVQQVQVIGDFQSGKLNLLVATSVAEEGLDIPACNLVIRFEHVTNEIAKTQTRGRIRAVGGEGFTILSSDSKRAYKEFKNAELEDLVEKALEFLPGPDILRGELEEKQRKMLQQLRMRKELRREQKKRNTAEDVQLKCKRCKAFACRGTDIYTMENSTHYVVPDKEFHVRLEETKLASRKVTQSMVITKGMACKECKSEWGVICSWPSHTDHEFPVLKCKQFVFEIAGEPRPVKKWSEVPFEIPTLYEHPDYQLERDEDFDTSSSDSD